MSLLHRELPNVMVSSLSTTHHELEVAVDRFYTECSLRKSYVTCSQNSMHEICADLTRCGITLTLGSSFIMGLGHSLGEEKRGYQEPDLEMKEITRRVNSVYPKRPFSRESLRPVSRESTALPLAMDLGRPSLEALACSREASRASRSRVSSRLASQEDTLRSPILHQAALQPLSHKAGAQTQSR